MLTTDQVITLVLGLGAGGLLREVVMGLWRWLTGRQDAERAQVQQAWRERDEEATRRRQLSEYAHQLRVILIAHGLGDKAPPFPGNPHLPPREPPVIPPGPIDNP